MNEDNSGSSLSILVARQEGMDAAAHLWKGILLCDLMTLYLFFFFVFVFLTFVANKTVDFYQFKLMGQRYCSRSNW